MDKLIIFLVIYGIAVVCSFLFFPDALLLLGLPWSTGVVIFGWLIIHAGSGKTLEWLLLPGTVPNFILIVRSILLRKMAEETNVD